METQLTIIFGLILHGLIYGMLIFLVASGFTLAFGMMDILNFAHASVYMIGAFLCYQIIQWTSNYWIALLVAPVLCGLIGIFMERIFIRKVHAAGHVNELLLTFGIAMVITEVVKWVYGTAPLPISVPPILRGSIPIFRDVTFPVYRAFILVLSCTVLFLMVLILKKTKLGISIRACVQDNEMANALGTNVSLVFMTVMGLGSWLAGVAGVIVGPYLTVNPDMYAQMILDCFVVVAVGGLGSLGGALVASLLVGQIQSFGIIFLPRISLILIYLLMALVFVFKPTGLFGEKE